ncbi:hypothetical protein ACT8MX_003310 [Escherichia albertii]|uniref:hypothetical protein n=1 Tax=Escherichia albertii TaxID=208962 RepID=UPI000744385F|nr:hypothetical protein [Escherichia albertii]
MTTPITKERLAEIIHAAGLEPCDYEEVFSSIKTGEIVKMARIALAAMYGSPDPAAPDSWITAVNRLLDSDGSRGCYHAIELAEAHRELEQLLSAQQAGSVSN